MESKLENAVQLLQSEGFAGAYSFVFPLPMSMRSIMRRPGLLSVNLPRRF